MIRNGTYLRFGQLGQDVARLGQRLLRLARADHVFENPGEVLLDPSLAALKLAALSGGDDDHPEAERAKLLQAFERTVDRQRSVQAVSVVELFYFVESFLRAAPARVLTVFRTPRL